MSIPELTYEKLRDAVGGKAYAFRAVVDLYPAGGTGDKVFPPTYEGSTYAIEERIIDGERLQCVLLDSVQSQANRMELLLLEWHRETKGEKPFPLVQIDFRDTEAKEAGVLTALETPHRIADAYFLNCEIFEGGSWKLFRSAKNKKKSSEIGKEIDEASPRNATPIFKLCPTALIFGMWDSHGPMGGLGVKFQRVLVSEIIGVDITAENKRPTSRIDPLISVAGESLKVSEKPDGTFELKDEAGKEAKRLSEVGLGNVTPTLYNKEKAKLNHGGVTLRYARQIAVLSLPALRRLRFPLPDDGGMKVDEDVNIAARTTLAALALAALARQWESGFSLRSRCDMAPRPGEKPYLSLLSPEKEERFMLSFEGAVEIMKRAVSEARKTGLPWPTSNQEKPWENGILTLRPNKNLVDIILRSWELAASKKDQES